MPVCATLAVIAAAAVSVSVSFSPLPNVTLTEGSNDCFLLSWVKFENKQNANYCRTVTPSKGSPLIKYVLDNQGNSTLKTLCLEKREAKYEISAASGTWCENSSVLQNVTLTESSKRLSKVEKYIRLKWPFMLVGAGATLVIFLFLAAILVCLQSICKRYFANGSTKNWGSHFSLDSDTVVGTEHLFSQSPAATTRASDSRQSATFSANSGSETSPPLEGPRSTLPDPHGNEPTMHPSALTPDAQPRIPRRQLPPLPEAQGLNPFATLPRHHVASRSTGHKKTTSSATLGRLSTRPPAQLPRLPDADTLPRPPAVDDLPRPSDVTLEPGFLDRLSRRPPAPLPPEAGVAVSRLQPLSPSLLAKGRSERPATCEDPPPLPPFTQRPSLSTASSSTLPRNHALIPRHPRSLPLPPAGTCTLPRSHSPMSKRPLPPVPRP